MTVRQTSEGVLLPLWAQRLLLAALAVALSYWAGDMTYQNRQLSARLDALDDKRFEEAQIRSQIVADLRWIVEELRSQRRIHEHNP